jgi:hypothetical protein
MRAVATAAAPPGPRSATPSVSPAKPRNNAGDTSDRPGRDRPLRCPSPTTTPGQPAAPCGLIPPASVALSQKRLLPGTAGVHQPPAPPACSRSSQTSPPPLPQRPPPRANLPARPDPTPTPSPRPTRHPHRFLHRLTSAARRDIPHATCGKRGPGSPWRELRRRRGRGLLRRHVPPARELLRR